MRLSLALAFALLSAALLSGCLFPPVQPPVEAPPTTTGPEEPGNESVPSGPPVFLQRNNQSSEAGRIDTGASLPGGMHHGAMLHVFDLPERVVALRVILDWDHDVYDLDLGARLLTDPEDPDNATWEAENGEGSTGDPQSPSTVETADRSRITFEAPTQLRVNVTTESAADVAYTVTVHYTYLVPED